MVVRKKDENGDYNEFWKCGDYRPLNAETDLDRYQLPLFESIFNDMRGSQIFSKLDLRLGYHQVTPSIGSCPNNLLGRATHTMGVVCGALRVGK